MDSEIITIKNNNCITFVSNYINHHQIPFCEAMCSLMEERGGSFTFIQTQPMEEERKKMGWREETELPFVRLYYMEETYCRKLIMDSDVVLFGGCDDESYIVDRLRAGKPVIRISERLYKTGQWKAVSPRGLIKKYKDHTRYQKAPVYLLCAGGYVSSDFDIIKAYRGKMYKWGYFPRTVKTDVDKLMAEKGGALPHILWAGRFIDWKHPELAVETAAYLKKKGFKLHMDIIGGGDMEEQLKTMLQENDLTDMVDMHGYKSPDEVRKYMEKADIFLFTSDRQEGWGAVANEAMNSGCAIVADHMIGAVPFLIRQNYNGIIYKDGDKEELFKKTEYLIQNPQERKRLGINAYRTIVDTWNPENAASRLVELIDNILNDKAATSKSSTPECRYPKNDLPDNGPCSKEIPVKERRMYKYLVTK
jgi:glycosyltransferase involved in cell wall biosynthesis